MTLTGMDIESVRTMGKRLRTESEELSRRIGSIGQLVGRFAQIWRGTDSAELQALWRTQLHGDATQAAQALREFGDIALRNADAQAAASAAEGGLLTSAATSGSSLFGASTGDGDKVNDEGGKLVRMDRVPAPDREREDFDPKQIEQRGIGDCWMLAGMIGVAERDPQFLADHIRVDDENHPTKYIVTLYEPKEHWENVTLGHRIQLPTTYEPVDVEVPFDQARFEHGAVDRNGNPTLASAYEVAVAKFRSGHSEPTPSDITGGFASESLPMLTGQPARIEEDPSFDDIQKGLDEHRAYVVGTNHETDWFVQDWWRDTVSHEETPQQPQLVAAHEYAVERIGTDEQGRRVIYLRNPWQNFDESQAKELPPLTEEEFHKFIAKTYSVPVKR